MESVLANWKTTLAGICKALILVGVIAAILSQDNPVELVSVLLGAYGIVDIGQSVISRDANVSSEQSGIKRLR